MQKKKQIQLTLTHIKTHIKNHLLFTSPFTFKTLFVRNFSNKSPGSNKELTNTHPQITNLFIVIFPSFWHPHLFYSYLYFDCMFHYFIYFSLS